MNTSERVRQALAELERALGDFREAYFAWLDDARDDAKLRAALAKAEERLDAARALLADAADAGTHG